MSWDEERVERLLGERARERGLDPLPADAPDRMLAGLRADRGRARWRRRAGWVGGLAALVLAVVTIFTAVREEEAYGLVDLELALLNTAGRELDSALRGDPEGFQRLRELLIEVVPASDGHLRLAAYGPSGLLAELETGVTLEAGQALSLRRRLEGYEPLPRGDSSVSWLVLSSTEPIPDERLSELLAPRLAEAQGPGRRAELDQLAEQVSSEFGCSAAVLEALVARRAP